jgi:hypothetical protein
MSSRPDPRSWLLELQDELGRAQLVTPDLMSKVVAAACSGIAMPAKAARINRLIESEAWTEAALLLVELDLPLWKLRRLVCENGAWLCSLGRQCSPRVWLMDCAEARHESLPLSILSALIEAQQCGEPPSMRAAGSVPQCRAESSSPFETVCCDNFA